MRTHPVRAESLHPGISRPRSDRPRADKVPSEGCKARRGAGNNGQRVPSNGAGLYFHPIFQDVHALTFHPVKSASRNLHRCEQVTRVEICRGGGQLCQDSVLASDSPRRGFYFYTPPSLPCL